MHAKDMDPRKGDMPNAPRPPSEPNINRRSSEHPSKPPSEPPIRKTTSDDPDRPPSEPKPPHEEEDAIPPRADLDPATVERLIKRGAASKKEHVTAESGVD